MADSHTRKNIFETFDNYDSVSHKDFQPSDPVESGSSEDDTCKEQEIL